MPRGQVFPAYATAPCLSARERREHVIFALPQWNSTFTNTTKRNATASCLGPGRVSLKRRLPRKWLEDSNARANVRPASARLGCSSIQSLITNRPFYLGKSAWHLMSFAKTDLCRNVPEQHQATISNLSSYLRAGQYGQRRQDRLLPGLQ
jgi:hypothetical protein